MTKILFCSLQYIFVLQSLIRFCFVKTFLCLSLVFEIVAKFVRSRWLDISLVVFYAVIYGPRRILKIFDPSMPVVGGRGGGRRALLGDLKRQAFSERHQRFTCFYFIWLKIFQFQLVYWLRGLNSLMSYGNDFSLWKQNERRESGNINATCKTKLSMNKYLELKASRPLAYTCYPANVLTVSLILQ